MEDIWQRRLEMLTKLLNFVNIIAVSFPSSPRSQTGVKTTEILAGSCTPSLISREGRCYQWSPLDGEAGERDILFYFYSDFIPKLRTI